MKNDDDIGNLIRELEDDLAILVRLENDNQRAQGRIAAASRDDLDYAALGYTIHNIYCLFENYFLRIAKFFENSIDESSWHSSLVRRMTMDIPDMRPRLLDDEAAEAIDELRSFRHVFRNLYQRRLNPEKMDFVQRLIPKACRLFRESHVVFVAKLREVDRESRAPNEDE